MTAIVLVSLKKVKTQSVCVQNSGNKMRDFAIVGYFLRKIHKNSQKSSKNAKVTNWLQNNQKYAK